MKFAMQIDYAGGFAESAAKVAEFEKAGLDIAWVAEAYGFDAPTFMGYLAAKTESITIGAGILPIYTRTPTLMAMTAASMDTLTGGRFILGLGASGPQVIEGFHGVKYDAPLGRTREVIDICRLVWKRERVTYNGKYYTLPLPADQGTGLGKPLKMIAKPIREDIPVWIASLGPKNVEMTAEIADGWLPIFYMPERAQDVWGADLAAGTAKRDPRHWFVPDSHFRVQSGTHYLTMVFISNGGLDFQIVFERQRKFCKRRIHICLTQDRGVSYRAICVGIWIKAEGLASALQPQRDTC